MNAYRRTLAMLLPLCALSGGAWGAAGPESVYPSKPITIVVPYPPGGQGDVMARLVGERLGTAWKQPVIVENRPGASAVIGTKRVVEAAPDGYTLLMGQTGEIAVNASVIRQPGYDPTSDLEPVVLVANAPLLLAAPATAGFSDLAGMLKHAKSQPGKISYASTGNATPGRLASAALAQAAGVELLNVPYKSAGQVMTDLLGNHIDLFFVSTSAFRPHVESGKLRPVAVATLERLAAFPDTPTIAEQVQPGFSYTLWAGLFAPKGTPAAVIERINHEVNLIMAQPDIRERLDTDGSAVAANSPQEFAQFVKKEISKYSDLVRATGIQAE